MISVLYVDDEGPMRQAVETWLTRSGHEVRTARSVAAAKRCFAKHRFDVAFIDIWLPDGTGFELFSWMQEHYPGLAAQTIFVTGDIVPDVKLRTEFEALGRPVLAKPFDLEELDRLVRRHGQRRPPDAPRPQARS